MLFFKQMKTTVTGS